jgi:sugar-specific transcriptional regulator TrmB
MNALENIKNSLIDRILATRNEQLLEAIKSIFESTQSEDIISLSTEQIEMLSMSEKDIEQGKLVSESELSKRDSKLPFEVN